MTFAELLRLVGDDPLFDSSVLQAGKVRPGYIQRQLSGWTSSGKLLRLRRGRYATAKPYRKVEPQGALEMCIFVMGCTVDPVNCTFSS